MKNHLLPAVALCTATLPAHAHAATRWVTQHSGKPAFALQTPAGWTVRSKGGEILAQSGDRSSFALIDGFSGGSAAAKLSQIAASRPDLFPGAKLGAVSQSGANAASASLAFSGQGGKPGQARLLSSVSGGSGIVYAIAAPVDRFVAQKNDLLRIVKSLRFAGPVTARSAPLAKLRFVKWTDPKEHAFSLEAPAGWKVEGGAFRIAATDVNQAIMVTSPDSSMLIRFGDAQLPNFEEPNPQQMQMYGVGEGVPFNPNGKFMMMFLHFMPAPEFNAWYLNKVLGANMDQFEITKTTNAPQVANRQAAELRRQAGNNAQVQVTAAFTEFKGVDKKDHKPITGVIATAVQQTAFPRGGVFWGPTALVISGCTADEQVAARQSTLRSAVEHISKTWQGNLKWEIAEQQRMAQGTSQVIGQSQTNIAAIGARAKAQAASADASRRDIMSGYWQRVGAQNDMQRQQANYYGDRTDVGGDGQSFNVGAGYSSYYFNPRTNSVVGTNSAGKAAVDLTPLTEY